MAVNNPRNKVFIFRLTQDEYAALQAASSAQGARSLSDFARAKLLRSAHAPAVEDQLAELKTTVARIAVMLEGTPASSAGPSINGTVVNSVANPNRSPIVNSAINAAIGPAINAAVNPAINPPINPAINMENR
jgi:hypothetical protein